MPDDTTNTLKDLEQLGKRVRIGWAKLYPAVPKELVAVRETLRAQWESKQENAQAEGADKSTQETNQATGSEKDLEQLGKRVRIGWAKLYPAVPKELVAVRQTLRAQWESKQGNAQAEGADKPTQGSNEIRAQRDQSQQKAAKEKEQQRKRSPGHDHDEGHSH